MVSRNEFDVIVVGGGPAGLVACTYLARFRRSVLLVDAGDSRSAKIPRSHNYPGYPDGIGGGELLRGLRAQTARYAVESIAAKVEGIDIDGVGFRLNWSGGSGCARAVLLATGASDVEPDMPHLAEALHGGALRYCPVCDGFEVAGQAVGVIGNGPEATREALYLRHFTDRLTLFMVRGASSLDASDRELLADAGIEFVAEPIRSLHLRDQRVAVGHGTAETACDAVYSALGMRIHSELATRLGAKVDRAGYLVTDRHQRTSVPGLYAAGDVASGLNQISVAAGGAAIASAAIHQMLRTTDRKAPLTFG